MSDYLIVQDAAEHNLKNISIKIPKDKLVVFTGVSGSGKSSLLFETIFAECQRRYLESLSAYARQFLDIQKKPNVKIIGASPAIAIEQKTTSKNPRSTVGTITEIYDYMRLLFARIGVPYSPANGKPIKGQSSSEIVDILLCSKADEITILAPIARGEKGEFKKEFAEYKKRGYDKFIVNSVACAVLPKLDKTKKHNIEIVIDKLKPTESNKTRLAEAVESSLAISDGIIYVDFASNDKNNDSEQQQDCTHIERQIYSSKYACPVSGFQIAELEPRLFSFNNPFGACPKCDGLGYVDGLNPNLLIENPNLSVVQGALRFTNKFAEFNEILISVAQQTNIDIGGPFKDLSPAAKRLIFYGSKKEFRHRGRVGRFNGLIDLVSKSYLTSKLLSHESYSENLCSECLGYKLSEQALCVKINNNHIGEVCDLNIERCLDWLEQASKKMTPVEISIVGMVVKEISERLRFLLNVGLGYLTLSRIAGTLSGGENQRIRLASQIGSGLTGVIYVLDEPSIGLHQRDNERLINTLKNLRNLGNSVLVVEHDEDTILAADYVFELGPGAGEQGGTITAEGSVEQIIKNPDSITGRYLKGIDFIPLYKPRKKPTSITKYITITGAKKNNLKNVTVSFPLETFVAVTGASGSGKSTLILRTLLPAIKNLHIPIETRTRMLEIESIVGCEHINKVIEIDQSPIGRTPRSNPATYVGVFTDIRDWFAGLPDSMARGYDAGRFSFNVGGGRCDACEGDGVIKIEMNFMPDVHVKCEVCKGKRYNKQTLDVKYKDKSIADVLEMDCSEALSFFEKVPNIYHKMKVMCDVGLGYIKLGQSATTLSGGEAQRVKLAKELSRRASTKTMYIFDEPTTGLHFDDVNKILQIFHHIVSLGHTVIVIEHNMDVIKTAGFIIDIGPEGGENGGELVCCGTPEEVAEHPNSFTGKFLKRHLINL